MSGRSSLTKAFTIGVDERAIAVPPRRSTVGDRAFPVAASRVWNSLPLSVTSLQSLPVFKRQLKAVPLVASSYDC